MNNDKNTTIQEIKDLVRKFCDERDWSQFHDPKNLAEAISIEAAELQELFLWKNSSEIKKEIESNSDFRKKVEHELMDVVSFVLTMANSLDIDVAKTFKEKMEINNKKYSVEKSKGRADKYDKL